MSWKDLPDIVVYPDSPLFHSNSALVSHTVSGVATAPDAVCKYRIRFVCRDEIILVVNDVIYQGMYDLPFNQFSQHGIFTDQTMTTLIVKIIRTASEPPMILDVLKHLRDEANRSGTPDYTTERNKLLLSLASYIRSGEYKGPTLEGFELIPEVADDIKKMSAGIKSKIESGEYNDVPQPKVAPITNRPEDVKQEQKVQVSEAELNRQLKQYGLRVSNGSRVKRKEAYRHYILYDTDSPFSETIFNKYISAINGLSVVKEGVGFVINNVEKLPIPRANNAATLPTLPPLASNGSGKSKGKSDLFKY